MATGPVIDGFDDLHEIGRGGFSVVYAATQVALGRRVAIKVIDVAGADGPRLGREATALGRLAGIPNVVTAFELLQLPDGRAGLVMDLMSTSLGELIRREIVPTAEVVAKWLPQIAGALDEAHRRGVYHRDIKPDNVLISAAGDAYLADFGIASIDSLAANTATLNSLTPQHASPERLADDVVDQVADDVYSLGSTVYSALAGHPPFGTAAEGGVSGLVSRVLNDPVPRLPQVSGQVQAVMDRVLAKDPTRRLPTAGGFAAELATAWYATQAPDVPGAPLAYNVRDEDRTVARLPVADSGPRSAGPVEEPEPGGTSFEASGPRKRQWAKVAAVGVLGCLLAGLAAAALLRPGEERPSEPWRDDFVALWSEGASEGVPSGLGDCIADELESVEDPVAFVSKWKQLRAAAPAPDDTTALTMPMDSDELMGIEDTLRELETTCVARILDQGQAPSVRGPATDLAVTRDSACVLVESGEVACWGSNWDIENFDEEGFGPYGIRYPVQIEAPPGREIQMGDWSFLCVVSTGNDLSCNDESGAAFLEDSAFGTGTYGTNTYLYSDDPRELGPVEGLGKVSTVAMGSRHRCAVLTDATVACWGSNQFGQLGDNSRVDRARAAPVPGLSSVVDVAAGEDHTCALRADGSVWCWGINGVDFGFDLQPVQVTGLPPIVELAGGQGFGCGVGVDGSVWCWGYLVDLLGDRSLLGNRGPVQVGTEVPMRDIDAAGTEACAVSADGRVWCFGDGRPLPREVPNWVQATTVGVATERKCSLDELGAVACWGPKAGPPDDTGQGTPLEEPVPVDGLGPA